MGITSKRNYGVDLLRLVAMLMVTTLHILGHGGALNAAEGIKGDVIWGVEIASYCAVNCYAMISGYVSFTDQEKPYKYSKFASIWAQVVFYSLGITILWYCLGKTVIDETIIKNTFLPVSTSRYWYFSAYTGLFFVTPWLNRFVRNISKNDMTRFIVLMVVIFSCYSNYCQVKYTDVFKLGNGYTFVWIVIMYFVGAWLKKCEIPQKVSSISAIVSILICMLITCCMKFFAQEYSGYFVSYISPTIVVMAACYIIVFARLKINRFFSAIIKFFAPAAFGVYLIHEHVLIRSSCITNRFLFIAELPSKQIPFVIAGCALAVFTICLLIERTRIFIFNLLRVNKGIEFVAFKIETLLKKLWLKIYKEKN